MFASLCALALAGSLRPLPVRAPTLPPGALVQKADPAGPQTLKLSLMMRDRKGPDALIAEQHQPGSPMFRHWLTPEEFGEHFGASGRAYENLARSLEKAGLVTERFPNRLYLSAVGSVAAVSSLLGVHF